MEINTALGEKGKTMKRFDENEECLNILHNLEGALENRLREVYNKAYKQGLKDGANEVIAKLTSKILEEAGDTEQTDCPWG